LLHTGETELQADRAARRPRSRAAAGRQAFADLNFAVEPLQAGQLADGDRLQRRANPVSPDRGLEGKIRAGNEAITYYHDPHDLYGECDFVMANPPFNVDEVDAEKVKGDPRLPFGLPGVNKAKKVSNGNYLWISYFWSYLNGAGRAGFVMSSQASSAGHGEAEVRRKIIETGDVDVMIAIRPNFFYTRTLPCELWFLDRGKPEARRDTVLILDARNVFRKVTRKIYDFSPEQLANLTAIVWLYRGEQERFLDLV
jgi:type I restriction enzyme M protein